MPLRRRSETDHNMVIFICYFFDPDNCISRANAVVVIRVYHFADPWHLLHISHRFHGREEVKDGGRYKITLEKDQTLYHMARLEISKVTNSDKGEYRAVARNMHGEGVATINLNFEGTGKPKYINFI